MKSMKEEFKESKEYVARNMNKWKLNFAPLELFIQRRPFAFKDLPFESEL